MYGAAILTLLAASRSGAGYTYVLSSGKFPVSRHPDFLVLTARPKLSDYKAIAIGPGFKNIKKIKNYLQSMTKQKIKNVVIDAEALNVLTATNKKLPPTWIITPHEGELSRILKVSANTIRSDRLKYVISAQKN